MGKIKQLEEQIIRLQDLKQSMTRRISDLQDDVKTLENANEGFKEMKRTLHRDIRDFEQRHRTHREIVMGEAPSDAKIEVLKDLFGRENIPTNPYRDHY